VVRELDVPAKRKLRPSVPQPLHIISYVMSKKLAELNVTITERLSCVAERLLRDVGLSVLTPFSDDMKIVREPALTHWLEPWEVL